jgi:hypothetical protein
VSLGTGLSRGSSRKPCPHLHFAASCRARAQEKDGRRLLRARWAGGSLTCSKFNRNQEANKGIDQKVGQNDKRNRGEGEEEGGETFRGREWGGEERDEMR